MEQHSSLVSAFGSDGDFEGQVWISSLVSAYGSDGDFGVTNITVDETVLGQHMQKLKYVS